MSALTKVTLLTLTIAGIASIHGLSVATGFYGLIDSRKEKLLLSDGTAYSPSFTGFAPVDDLIGTLVQFFWPCLSGEAPGLSLMSALFGGQAAAWVPIYLFEGLRAGNRGKAVSYISVYVALVQAGGFAMVGPAYLLLYSLTSPTVTAPTATNLAIDPALVSGIPFGLFFGFIAPSVLMSLPSPSVLSDQAKVTAIAAWQPAPIYAIGLTYLWRALSGASASTVNSKDQLKAMRKVYKFALAIAATTHTASWTLSLGSLVLPSMFSASIGPSFSPLAAIFPANPLTSYKTATTSVAAGSLSFLQWDYLVSSAAYLAVTLNARYTKAVDEKGFTASELVGLLGRIATLGPMGTVLSLLWERDEIVLGKGKGQKKLN